MKPSTLFLLCLLVLPWATPGRAAEDLAPGKVLQLTFPELPQTLRALKDPAAKGPTSVSLRLPDNYSKDRPFPLLVFLHGGQGGLGSEVDLPMAIVGKSDYVVATFPLFKARDEPDESWGGIAIDAVDYAAVSHAYRTILERIQKTVPNLDPQRSVLGGYSNGGNALAVLLSALDPPTLKAFRRFFLIDSGMNWSGYQRNKSLGDCDILFVAGGGNATPEWFRKYLLSRLDYYKEVAGQLRMSRWKFVVVDGADHGDLTKFFPAVKGWVAEKPSR